MREILAKIPYIMAVMITLLLGLAPFSMGYIASFPLDLPLADVPEAHILEKLKMLSNGALTKPLDMFDLVMHGAPWFVLIMKTYYGQFKKGSV